MSKTAPSWLKAGSYSLLGYGAQLGLAFVSFLVLVRLLPNYEFGVWVLFLTVASFADMARMGLTQNAIVKFCVEEEENYGAVATAGLILNTACTLLLGGLLIVLGGPLSRLWEAPELAQLLWWYPVFALLLGTARYIDNLQMAHSDFRGIFWSKATYGIGFLVAIGAYWYSGKGQLLSALPVLQIAAAVPSLIVALAYQPAYLRFGKLQRAWCNRIFHFGKYVLGTNFSSMLFNKMDLMMVGAFINPLAVGLYNVASRVTNYMEVPMSGISQAVYPRVASINQRGDMNALTRLYEHSVGVLLATLLPMAAVVLLLAEPVVVLLAGRDYASAAPILCILVLAVLAKPWSRLFGITLDAIGRPKLNFALLAAALVGNVILNLIFIPLWGVKGAALASLCAIWGMTIAGQIILLRILPVQQRNIWKKIGAFYRRPMVELKLEH